MSFADLKKNRAGALDNLTKELEKVNNKGGGKNDDDRFWTPTLDKDGNGSAIIRFLPAPDGEDVPFIRIWDHGFQGPGGWYIEKSLTTIGKDDPCAEYNSTLWNSGNDADKETARDQKRRLSFYANIYVVQDRAAPENEGKVFLYKFGKKIFDKIADLKSPSFEDETPVNAFDLWEGANFRLRIRKFEGYRNYDKSEFDKPSQLLPSDEDLEAVWRSEHKLQPFLNPSEFKSYDELKARLDRALGNTGTKATTSKGRTVDEDAIESPRTFKAAETTSAFGGDDDDTADDIDFFSKLAKED